MSGFATIVIDGVPACLRAFDAVKTEAALLVQHSLREGAGEILMEMKDRVNVDLGGLKDELHDVVVDRNFEAFIGSDLMQSIYLEYGTGPHRTAQGSDQFIENITGWAERHGIEPWALIQHIRAHGTVAHPFAIPAWEAKKKAFPDAIKKHFKRLGGKGP